MTDYGIRCYRLRGALLRRALLEGFTLTEDGALRAVGSGAHRIWLPALDSGTAGTEWGRLTMGWRMGPDSMLTVRAFAFDQAQAVRGGETVWIDDLLTAPEVPLSDKEKLFTLTGGLERSGVRDVLLDGQTGRWLWLWLEISGVEGDMLEDLRVYVPGDNFFRTLPQVYRTDNDFLRRYLTIFSTMFQEFQEEIDALPEQMDVDTAPAGFLPMLAAWLGLEVDETLFTEAELRRLLKAAPQLLARKGTRVALEMAVRLFVEEPVYIVERNLLLLEQQYDEKLYGTTPYDFTVMIGCKLDERLRLRLLFLINQLKPVRSRCHVVFLEECGGMDAFTYLGVNSTVLKNAPGSLDDGKALTGMTYLR